MRSWRRIGRESLYRHRLFELRNEELEGDDGERREAVVLDAPAWVNVVALDGEGGVLLVRQWRFGIGAPTLEIPGGMVERGEAPIAAAGRELLEETGYRATSWRPLGEVDPNPAFLTNRCATFLAEELERVGAALGDGEEELEVERVPLTAIPGLILDGTIRHALVVAAFHFLELDRARAAGSATHPR